VVPEKFRAAAVQAQVALVTPGALITVTNFFQAAM
jgi:hypothetical protein